MKTVIICFLLVLVSIFGLNATSNVSEEQARKEGQIQIVKAEEPFEFTEETNLEKFTSPNIGLNSLEDQQYIPDEFEFLKEEENDELIYRIVFNLILKK